MGDGLQRQRERYRAKDRCRSCAAEVLWVITAGGQRMPINPDPVPGGNLRKTGRRVDYKSVVEFVDASSLFADTTDEPRFVSHFATCPNADEWRRRSFNPGRGA